MNGGYPPQVFRAARCRECGHGQDIRGRRDQLRPLSSVAEVVGRVAGVGAIDVDVQTGWLIVSGENFSDASIREAVDRVVNA